MVGPGAYLARWQNLLDNTLITPAKAFGDVRTGADTSGFEEHDGRGFGIVFEEVVCSSHASEASTDDENITSLGEVWRAAVAVE